jgi:hypothetical protein
MCGEMIVIGAAKCRFCDAVFDENLRRAGKKKRRGGSSSGYEADLSVGDWVVCVIRPEIGLIGGLVYLMMGKPKAWKVLGASVLFFVVQVIIGIAIAVAQHAHDQTPPFQPPGFNQPQPGLPPGFPRAPGFR